MSETTHYECTTEIAEPLRHIAADLSEIRDSLALLPSRRERIATACLSQIVGQWGYDPPNERYQDRARTALRYADALIVELDRESK